MFDVHGLVINHFVEELREAYQQTYSHMHPEYGNIIVWTAQLALENLANSDALYHNVEHTILVTSVGQSILKGKHLIEGGVTPKDWMHFTMALLCHDIGYVKGICQADKGGRFATGVGDETVELPSGGTDAALQPYHVDRSQLFVRERFGGTTLQTTDVDPETIVSYIEMSRFPIPEDEAHQDPQGYGALIRAADFIGQLGDPKYPRKIPALYYEFVETGVDEDNGYTCPGDMRTGYAEFYWQVVHPQIEDVLKYLYVTQEGKLWIANLHAHVFDAEHTAASAAHYHRITRPDCPEIDPE